MSAEPDDDWTTHPAAARLLGVHALLRRDLARLRAAVADLESGRGTVAKARTAVDVLAGGDPTAEFRQRCLMFCGFLHDHHFVEDEYFPQLAAAEPGLGLVVDRLVAEHLQVAGLIAAIRWQVNGPRPDLRALRTSLTTLRDHLDAHLDYEEEHIGPALARLA